MHGIELDVVGRRILLNMEVGNRIQIQSTFDRYILTGQPLNRENQQDSSIQMILVFALLILDRKILSSFIAVNGFVILLAGTSTA